MNYLDRVPLSDAICFSVYLYQQPLLKLFSLDGKMKHVWSFSVPRSCLGCAELLVCGPHRSTAAWRDRGSLNSSRATADKHSCMNGSDASSLDQGGVKVKAEVGEREEKQAERGCDELKLRANNSKCPQFLCWSGEV